MHFFLDESGPFIPLDGDREKVSVVAEQVVFLHSFVLALIRTSSLPRRRSRLGMHLPTSVTKSAT